MDYRKKYLKFKDKDNKISQANKKIIQSEKEEKPKMDNSYLQKLLQNSNKTPKSSSINLKSYNENLPSFRVSIRDILSTEENKQKAINYVIQKRNEEKYGKKTNLSKSKEQTNNNNLLSNKNNNYIYNSNSKILNKNNTVYNTNRTYNNNINQKLNNKNNINISQPNYSYFIERRNKPYISSRINDVNLIDNFGINNNIRNNYLNKIKTKTNLNENNIEGRNYIIRGDINNNHNKNNYKNNTTNVSPNYSQNISNISNNNTNERLFKKIKKYQILRSNKTNREPQNPNPHTERLIQEYDIIKDKPKYKHIGTYLKNKEINNKIIINKIELNNNKNNVNTKSYDLLPFNRNNKNVSIYYSRYSKKDDNESKSKEREHRIHPKLMFKDYKNFKISKNNLQLNTKKDNKYKLKNNKIKKNKIIKEKNIEINISGINVNINNDTTNLKFTKKNNKNKNELLFKDDNELIDYINNKYENDKKIEVFKIEKIKNLDKKEKSDELEKIKERLNEEIYKNKEKGKEIKKLKLNIE